MTPDKNFKMLRLSKVMLATGRYRDSNSKAQHKKLLIDAQLRAEVNHRASLKTRDRSVETD